jgi:hypothetical protein
MRPVFFTRYRNRLAKLNTYTGNMDMLFSDVGVFLQFLALMFISVDMVSPTDDISDKPDR